jgi:hypothetical protein
MKKLRVFSPVLLIAGGLALSAGSVSADNRNLDLEPCINGGVSASGSYETPAHEDAAQLRKQLVFKADVASGAEDVIAAFGGQRDDFLR